jgi:hypothetical protein
MASSKKFKRSSSPCSKKLKSLLEGIDITTSGGVNTVMGADSEPLENIVAICSKCVEKKCAGGFTNTSHNELIGKFAKLAFPTSQKPAEIPSNIHWPNFERMWVKISSSVDGELRGTLDNDPIFVFDLENGSEIGFTANEIIEIMESTSMAEKHRVHLN